MNYNQSFGKVVIPLRASLFAKDHIFCLSDSDKLNALNDFSHFLALLLSNGKMGLT